MKQNRLFKWIGVAGLGLMLSALAVPAAQALTVNAFVVKQTCVNGDIVAVTLSATVSPAQPAKYRWDFTNNGTFDTALNSNPRVTHNYPDERRFTARVRVVNAQGMLRGTVQNFPGGETSLVQLHFDYRTDANIALDELISQIVIWTNDRTGNEFSKVTIDPNSVPLNPNRVRLHYAGTVYKPPRNNRTFYIVTIQVFGNYE